MAEEKREHSLSPSAWNRFETCPRQYWLSRQRLPRKTGMAASLGTAVHASIEDLVVIDLSGKKDSDSGWMPDIADKLLRKRWEEEKEIFHNTPRRPAWKEGDYSKAKRQQRGAIDMLLAHAGATRIEPERVTVALWKRVMSLVIAAEGELRTKDGRLMGRLDLLLAEVGEDGKLAGWVVADLKTGRPPEGELKPEVRRQLLMYRDILLSNNPNAPPVRAEGWYTDNSRMYRASGESVLEDAYAAWEATQINEIPLEATPGDASCGGFCDWKAWCPHWWNWRNENGSLHNGTFCDAVVLIESYEESNGVAIAELCEPADDTGRPMPSGVRVGMRFDGRGKQVFSELRESGHQGPIFIGGAKADKETWRIGPWCDILPWTPITPPSDS